MSLQEVSQQTQKGATTRTLTRTSHQTMRWMLIDTSNVAAVAVVVVVVVAVVVVGEVVEEVVDILAIVRDETPTTVVVTLAMVEPQ
jgi:hypothetical protein